MSAIRLEPTVIGLRLRDARVASGLTQEQAAAAIQVARTTLVAIEQGARRIQPHELMKLCAAYEVSTNTLLQPHVQRVEVLARFRRSMGNATHDAHADEAVRNLAQLLAGTVELEQLLGRPLVASYPPSFPLGTGDISRQAEDAALDLRNRLGVGLAPVEDVLSLFELELGVRIFVRPLHSSVSGVFAYSRELGAAMLVNSKHPRFRRAMTIAHEGGHFLVSREVVDVLDESPVIESREERFAVQFASSFLMPGPAVRRKFQEGCDVGKGFSARHLILLSHSFHVSPEAMCRRLEGMGLLPVGTYDRLEEQGFSGAAVRTVLGDRRHEESAIVPPRLASLVAEAYQREVLSEEQLAERLGMKRAEIRDMLDSLDAFSEG